MTVTQIALMEKQEEDTMEEQLIATVRLPWGEMVEVWVRTGTNEPFLKRRPAP